MPPFIPSALSKLKAKQNAALPANLRLLKNGLIYFSLFLLAYLFCTAPLYFCTLSPGTQELITWGSLPLSLGVPWGYFKLSH